MKNKFLLLIVILIFISGRECAGQTVPHWQWAKGGSGHGATEFIKMATDPFGDVYCMGFYSDTLQFGSTSLIDSILSPHTNFFISKYNSAGQFQWAKTSEGDCNGNSTRSITSDLYGNVYVAGSVGNCSLFIIGSDTLTGPASFLAKYDSSGVEQWAEIFFGGGTCATFDVCTDLSGNVYITGGYSGYVTFGTTTLSSGGIFIVKINSSGGVIWATGDYGYGGYGRSISADNFGNVYVTGDAYAGASFGNDTILSQGYFLVKYDSSGNEIWLRTATGASASNYIATTPSGKIFVTGASSSQTITFGAYSLNYTTGSTTHNMYIVQYDSSGTVDWLKGSLGVGAEDSYSIASDGLGNAYITGRIVSPNIIFDNDTLNAPIGSMEPMYIVKYNSTGNVNWAIALSGGGDDWNGVAANNNGDVYVGGDYEGAINPFIIGNDTLPPNSVGEHPFVAKLGECIQSTHSISQTSCGSFTLNGQTYTSSGTYAQSLTSATSCDSILTIHLILNNNDTTVTQLGITLTANAVGCLYQWLDCNNGYSIISGETNQSFTPSTNGQYAVQVGQVVTGCTDTSSCFTIGTIGIDEQNKNDGITISPNPFTSQTTISSTKYKIQSIKIMNVLGECVLVLPPSLQGGDKQLVAVWASNGESGVVLDMSNVAKGIYFVQITDENKNVVNRKIIKS